MYLPGGTGMMASNPRSGTLAGKSTAALNGVKSSADAPETTTTGEEVTVNASAAYVFPSSGIAPCNATAIVLHVLRWDFLQQTVI
jgi:hypothetical protein